MYDKILVGTTTTWMKPEFINKALDMFIKGNVGNFIQLWPSLYLNGDDFSSSMYGWNETGEDDPWEDWIKKCIENKLHVQFCYTRLSQNQMSDYIDRLGDYFEGYSIGETEGLVAWAYNGRDHYISPRCENLEEARDVYIRHISKDIIARLGKKLAGKVPVWAYHSGVLRNEEAAGGVTSVMTELFAGDSFEKMVSFERGMYRSLPFKSWGSYLASSYWGGIRQEDIVKQKRTRLGLYYAYLAGAEYITLEGGVFHNDRGSTNVVRSFGPEMDKRFNDKSCQELRKTLADFYKFTGSQPRLSGGPKVKVAFVHGNLDGYDQHNGLPAPLSSWFVYGQYGNEAFRCGDPERMWDILSDIKINAAWDNRYEYGPESLSGSIPFGQYDVIDSSADIDILKNYELVVFTGWNTMTDQLYQKLVDYVKSGGHLVLSLPHLSTNIRRDQEWKFVNDGDISQLCGVKVKGKGEILRSLAYIDPKGCPYDLPYREYGRHAGFLIDDVRGGDVEVTNAEVIGENLYVKALKSVDDYSKPRFPFVLFNQLGDGHVMLLNSWDYPGKEGLYPIYAEMIQRACEHYGDKLRVLCREKVCWSVYTENNSDKVGSDFTQLFILNTDYDLPQHIRIKTPSIEFEWVLKPCEFRTFFVWQDVFYTLDVPAEMKIEDGKIKFYSQTDKSAQLWDSKSEKESQITLR